MTASRTADGGPARPLSPALDKTFKIGLVLKGLDGILEVIGGIVLLFLSPQAIQHLARTLTAHEPCGTRPRPAPGHSPQIPTGDRAGTADRGDSAALAEAELSADASPVPGRGLR